MALDSQTDTVSNNSKILLKIRKLSIILRAATILAIYSPAHSNEVQDSSGLSVRQRSEGSVPKNHRPVARPDFVDLKKSSQAFNALANDFDADGDRLTIIAATANFGAVAFTAEGLLAYAQEADQFRADKITYTITDGRGGVDQGMVEISAR